VKERFLVQVNKPPSTTIYSFAYDFNTTVKAALMNLLKDTPHAQAERFGLYYPMKGIWLEESKTLEFYEIDPTVSQLWILNAFTLLWFGLLCFLYLNNRFFLFFFFSFFFSHQS